MAFTYTRTHSKGEEEFHKAGQLFQDLGYSLNSVFVGAKNGTISLSFEIPEDCKGDFDSGIVTGEDFVLKKIDRFGDNPMYHYLDNKGMIFVKGNFVQGNFGMNSYVKFGDKSLYGRELMSNPEAIEYIKTTKNTMDELRKSPLREQLGEESNSKKL